MPGIPKLCLTPRDPMVVRAPRGPTETEVPRFPMLIETPERIFIRLWNLNPILNFLPRLFVIRTVTPLAQKKERHTFKILSR